MGYFAEVVDGVVVRVVVASDAAWCVDHLGGSWVETMIGDAEVVYCGPGFGCDPDWPERFAPVWRQPAGADVEGALPYDEGAVVFHDGRLWRSTTPDNVHAPGVSGWHDAPTSGVPQWVQPSGGHDAYARGARVTFQGRTYESTIDSNVWSPITFGWVVVDG